jgi:hypothetical protein
LEAAIEREQAEEKPLVLSIRQMLIIRRLAEYQITVSEQLADWEAIMQRIDLVTIGPVEATKRALERATERVGGVPDDVPDYVREALERDVAAEKKGSGQAGGQGE